MEKKYVINGKNYTQKKCCFGQLRQLKKLASGNFDFKSFEEGIDYVTLISKLETKIPEFIAVLLHEEGTKLKDKNVKELAEDLEFELDYEEHILAIIKDFFELTPISSFWEGTVQIIQTVGEKLGASLQNKSTEEMEETPTQ